MWQAIVRWKEANTRGANGTDIRMSKCSSVEDRRAYACFKNAENLALHEWASHDLEACAKSKRVWLGADFVGHLPRGTSDFKWDKEAISKVIGKSITDAELQRASAAAKDRWSQSLG